MYYLLYPTPGRVTVEKQTPTAAMAIVFFPVLPRFLFYEMDIEKGIHKDLPRPDVGDPLLIKNCVALTSSIYCRLSKSSHGK